MLGGSKMGERSDSGLCALVLMLRFHGVAVEVEQLRHQLNASSIGPMEMLRAAKAFGLKSRLVSSSWQKLLKTPVPALVERADGTFIVLGKVVGDRALVQDPVSGRPA